MRLRAPLAVSMLAGLCLSATALAVPPILDRCPKNALAVVAIPNFEAAQKDVDDMAKLMGMPLPFDLKKALASAGMEKGVKTDGSAAIVIFAQPEKKDAKGGKDKPKDDMGGKEKDADDDEDEDAEPPMVALIPITDYAALLSNFDAKPGDKGKVDSVKIQGADAFTKDIGGGFAAISTQRETLEAFSGAEGNKGAFEAIAGKAGSALADKADVSIIVNMPVARPMIEASMKRRMDEMADQMAMMGGEEPNFEAGNWMMQGLMNDSSGCVAALNIDKLGASMDMVMAFKEGSRWAKVSSMAGKASELMGKMPSTPYLLAAAVDMSSPELKSWLKELTSKGAKKDEPAAASTPGLGNWMANIDKNNGGAMMIGFSPAGVMGGLFTQSLVYTATTDPSSAVADTKAAFMTMQEKKLATVKWTDGDKEIAGVKCDTYEARMAPDPNNPFAAQGAAMMFGPAGGPAGYIAKVDGGVFMTLSKNSALMGSALAASKGENSLGQEKVLSQVAGMLPKGRVAEAYIGVKSILDTVLPAAAMFGMNLPSVDIPQNLPPAALALTPQQGSMQATIYLPAPTLKTVAEIAKEARGAMGGDPDAPPPARPEKKEGTGQPGF